tara:strand:+ start:469 stop:699 length:231 start_codon:yes stop_codon:yes gene_type:complete
MEDKKIETEKLSDADKNNLDIAIMNKKLALANAEKAIAQHENAELSYKYYVIQLYMKYGLKSSDSITESGEITRSV